MTTLSLSGNHWALIFGPLKQNWGRSIAAVAAIAIGVALGLAVQLINTAASNEFAQAALRVAGAADLNVRGGGSGFDEQVFAQLAQHPDVAVASPVLEVRARIAGTDESIDVTGIDIFRAAQIDPMLLGEDADPMDALSANKVFVSSLAMTQFQWKEGGVIKLQVGLDTQELMIAGTLATEGARGRVALMDIGAAQRFFRRLGVISRIDVRLRDGVNPTAFAAGLTLPAGVTVSAPEHIAETTARMTRAYRVNLNVLALVALFTGTLLVFSTQALSIARRRAALSLLRVIGFTRAQIARLILAEGVVIGLVGAGLGVVAGLALAYVALKFIGGDLGAGFFEGVAPALTVSPIAVLIFAVLGIGAALAGTITPAIEAARAAPAQALKRGDDARAFAALRSTTPGAILIAMGAAFAFLPPVDGLPVFGYLAIAALLLGTISLLPRLLAALVALLPDRTAAITTLAIDRLKAYPSQAGLSLAAIVAAVSLIVAMAVMVASFRSSLNAWLTGVLPADVYLRAGTAGESAFLSEADQNRVRAIDGIERLEFLRWQPVPLKPSQPRVTLLARDDVDQNAEQRLPLVGRALPAPKDTPRAWVSESGAALQGIRAGDVIEVPLGGQARKFFVAGLWRDYARPNGAILIDRATYIAYTGDKIANDAGLWLQRNASVADVSARLESLSPEGGMITMSPEEIRTLSLTAFDRTFAVTYALEAVAILIGLMGLSSALGAEVLARRKEFGMLRHLGVTRAQISQLLAVESAVVSGVGLVVGVALGFVMSLILIYVVNRQSFHWGMELNVPWLSLATFSMVMLLLATAVGIFSGRQATRADVISAVKEDW